MRDLTYPPVIAAAKTVFKLLGQRFQMGGTERVPREGGVLLAFNHVSYVDFIYGGLAAHPSGRLVRFMAKREVFDHPVGGPVMRSMHHISVDRSEGEASAQDAIAYLRAGEVVGIFPEATISRAMEPKEFKTGAVRIAAEAGVPLLPVALWGTQRLLTKDHPRDLSRGTTIGIKVGEPMHPTAEDPAAETAELRSRVVALVEDLVAEYPTAEQPPGSWWVPARLGGGAPTPDEAARLDVEEKRERARRRAARQANKSTK